LLPEVEGRAASIKDKVVPLLPNLPSSYDEDLHEGTSEMLFSLNYHLEEVKSHWMPTSLAERASKEEVEGSFFQVTITKDTIVVVPFQLVRFPFDDVSCI